jgi:hypothetical protein
MISFHLACLHELFGQSFLESSSTNDYYTGCLESHPLFYIRYYSQTTKDITR